MEYLSVRLPGIELVYQAYEEMYWVYEGLPKTKDLYFHYEILVEHKKRDFAIAFYGDDYFYDGRPGKPYINVPDSLAAEFQSYSFEQFLVLLHENNLSHLHDKTAFHKPLKKVW